MTLPSASGTGTGSLAFLSCFSLCSDPCKIRIVVSLGTVSGPSTVLACIATLYPCTRVRCRCRPCLILWAAGGPTPARPTLPCPAPSLPCRSLLTWSKHVFKPYLTAYLALPLFLFPLERCPRCLRVARTPQEGWWKCQARCPAPAPPRPMAMGGVRSRTHPLHPREGVGLGGGHWR